MRKKELIPTLENSIERIGFLLSEWIADYGFGEKPDPNKALQWTMENIDDIHCQQSAKWFSEYNRIHYLVDMALEYVFLSEKAIRQEQGAK